MKSITVGQLQDFFREILPLLGERADCLVILALLNDLNASNSSNLSSLPQIVTEMLQRNCQATPPEKILHHLDREEYAILRENAERAIAFKELLKKWSEL